MKRVVIHGSHLSGLSPFSGLISMIIEMAMKVSSISLIQNTCGAERTLSLCVEAIALIKTSATAEMVAADRSCGL